MLIYLYETTAMTSPSTSAALRLCNGRGYNHASAPGYFLPKITPSSTAAVFSRGIYPSRLEFGLGEVDGGVLEFVTLDGELDWVRDAGFGREATIKVGDEDAAYSSFTTVGTGIASNTLVDIRENVGQIGWQDKTKNLDKPVSDGLFAGTNSGTTGLEGLPADIKNQRKPRAWGKLDDIAPVLVNGPLRIYGWNNTKAGARAATNAVRALRVRGSAWTPYSTADYATAAALQAAAPSIPTGQFATCLAESLVAVGGSSTVDGAVRIDITVGATAAANYTGAIVESILLEMGEVSGTINSVERAAMDTARPYEVGYYTQDDTARDVVDALLLSNGGWSIPDPLGVYRFGVVPTTVGTAVATLREFALGTSAKAGDINIIAMTPILEQETKGVPSKSVQVRYGRRWGYQDIGSLASGLSDELKQAYSTEWRTSDIVTNSGVDTQFLNADEVVYNTFIHSSADAATFCGLLATLLGKKTQRYKIDIMADSATLALIRPGILVDVYHRRFGFSAGYQCFVTNVKSNAISGDIELEVLGVGAV